MNQFGDIFIRNLRSNPSLIDFKIENQRSNMSILYRFTQVEIAVDDIDLVPGKRIGKRADSKVNQRVLV